jgi:hypothetical protein
MAESVDGSSLGTFDFILSDKTFFLFLLSSIGPFYFRVKDNIFLTIPFIVGLFQYHCQPLHVNRPKGHIKFVVGIGLQVSHPLFGCFF